MILKNGTPEKVGMSSDKIKHVENLVEEWVDQGLTPAITACVARKGTIVFEKACGRQAPELNSNPFTSESIFPLASMSKQIVVTAFMGLLEDGRVSLNLPVQYYIPEFTGENKEKVMIHHLLSHTSGMTDAAIQRYTEEKGRKMDIPPVEENQHPEMHKRLFEGYSAPLINLPGKEMSYCSFGINLIGEVIRRISRKSLSDFLTERVLKPLGMNNTYLVVPKKVQERSVRYPKESCFGQWLANDPHFEIPSAAGGIYSTARDMTVFAQMYLNGGTYGDKRILSPVTVREMARDHIPGIPASHDNMDFALGLWGLSWNIFENKKDPESGALHSPSAYGHGGAGHTVVWIDPEYETVGCFYHMELDMSPFRPDNLFRNAVMSAITEI